MFNILKTKVIKKQLVSNYYVKTEIMTFTPKAIEQLKKITHDSKKNVIQLNVKKKENNHFSYKIELIKQDDILCNSEILKMSELTLAINPKSVIYVMGTQMDYIEDDIVSEFVFKIKK